MLTELVKRVGDSQGVSTFDLNPRDVRTTAGDSFLRKSQTWKLWDDLVSQFFSSDTEGSFNAFIQVYGVMPWVYVGCWMIASTIATLPFGIYKGKYRDMENSVEVTEGRVHDTVMFPNRFDDWSYLAEITGLHLELTGNEFWEKGLMYQNFPVELYALEPQYMKIIPDPKHKIAGYQYERLGETFEYEVDEIVHFRYANPSNPFWGQGSIKALQTTLITELYREAYNKSYFENEARPDVVLTHTPDPQKAIAPMMKEARMELAERWKHDFGGSRNTRKPIVLPPGFEMETLTDAIEEMGFREFEKSLRERVLGVLGVPPAMVGLFEYANYANSREQIKIFHTVTIPPKLRRIEASIDMQLLRPYDKEMWCQFDTSDIPALREDSKEQSERLSGEFDRGIISIEEYRKAKQYAKIDDKDGADFGKARFITSAMMPLLEALTAPIDEEPSGEPFGANNLGNEGNEDE